MEMLEDAHAIMEFDLEIIENEHKYQNSSRLKPFFENPV
jgi:hypothetical protein